MGGPLFRQSILWTPTWRGWCLAACLFVLVSAVAVLGLEPFLSVSRPLPDAEVLVVEGWLPDYALQEALAEFQRGTYALLVTTGVPLETGSYLAPFRTAAELAAATLSTLGCRQEVLVAVPGPAVKTGRTPASAQAFAAWLARNRPDVSRVNLVSLGPHARRSWRSFQEALAPRVHVGVIATKPAYRETATWWQTSEGVRSVLGESIALVYARLCPAAETVRPASFPVDTLPASPSGE